MEWNYLLVDWSNQRCCQWCTWAMSWESLNHRDVLLQLTMHSSHELQTHSFLTYQCRKYIESHKPSWVGRRWDQPSVFPVRSKANSVGDSNCYSCCWMNCYWTYCSLWRRWRDCCCFVPNESLRLASIQHTLHHYRYPIREYRVILYKI